MKVDWSLSHLPIGVSRRKPSFGSLKEAMKSGKGGTGARWINSIGGMNYRGLGSTETGILLRRAKEENGM